MILDALYLVKCDVEVTKILLNIFFKFSMTCSIDGFVVNIILKALYYEIHHK